MIGTTTSGRFNRTVGVSVSGDEILLDGVSKPWWGVRAGSATWDQSTTDKLLDVLDSYQAHGMNAVTVFFQGTSGGNSRCFSADGTSIDAGHLDRMKQIAQHTRARGMLLAVGLFYQNATTLTNAAAYEAATRKAAQELKPWRHIIFNIANENNSANWAGCPVDFRTAERVLEHCAFVHQEDPQRLVGGGGYLPSSSLAIALDARCDIGLFDSADTNSCGPDVDYFRTNGVTKPIVNVETFGGITKDIHATRGVYTDAWFKQTATKGHYIRDIDEAVARGVYSWFHDNRWTQPLSGGAIGTGFTEADIRYDLGDGSGETRGQGTSGSPGFGWWARYVRDNG